MDQIEIVILVRKHPYLFQVRHSSGSISDHVPVDAPDNFYKLTLIDLRFNRLILIEFQ